MDRKHIVIIGATSAIAEHCARLWSRQGPVSFVLVGRDAARLSPIATDLETRGLDTRATIREADFTNSAAISSLIASICEETPVDIALIAHGTLPDQKAIEADLQAAEAALVINGTSPVLFAEAFAGPMEKAGRGVIAVIGSVAGDRGRKSNYIYGGAKGLVETYLEGLRHRLAASGVKVVLVKPGPTDTPMTAHLREKGASLAPVEGVAADIVKGIGKGTPVVYTPRKWQLIMFVVRSLPRFIFHKTNF